MPDMQPDKVRQEVNQTKMLRLAASGRIQILIDGKTVLDSTVPVGKVFVGAVTLMGELESA